MFLISAGLIFVFYSLPLPFRGGMDLLPDFIGYLLIALDLWRLRRDSYTLARALGLSLFLAVYAVLVRLFVPTGLAGFFFSALELAAQLYLLQLLVDGVEDLETAVDRHLNHDVLDRWRQIVSIFWAGSYVCMLGNLFIQGVEAFGAVVALGSMVVCALFVITFFRTAQRYRKILRAGPAAGGPKERGTEKNSAENADGISEKDD